MENFLFYLDQWQRLEFFFCFVFKKSLFSVAFSVSINWCLTFSTISLAYCVTKADISGSRNLFYFLSLTFFYCFDLVAGRVLLACFLFCFVLFCFFVFCFFYSLSPMQNSAIQFWTQYLNIPTLMKYFMYSAIYLGGYF